MMGEPRKRSACDRCHSQKTKCPRTSGQQSCDRCLKAKATCVFRPFRQKKLLTESREDRVKSAAFARNELVVGHDEGSSDRISGVKRKRLMPGSQTVETTLAGSANGLIVANPDSRTPSTALANDLIIDDSNVLEFEADWMHQSFVLSGNDQNDIDTVFGHQDPFMSFDFCTGSAGIDYGSATTDFCSRPPLDFMGKFQGLSTTVSSSSSLSEPSHSNSLQHTSISSLRTTSTCTLVSCIRTLSQLSIDLYEHSRTIPPLSIYDPPFFSHADSSAPWSNPQDYAVDDAFRLTQAMIEVYPRFLAMFARQKDTPQLPKCGGIDHSSVLLILSCHLRLISIYEELFKHMELCMKQHGHVVTTHYKQFATPQINIGSYVPPASAALSLQMLLLIQFATQLFQFASSLAAEMQAPNILTASSDGNSSLESGGIGSQDATLMLTRAAAENVKDRAGSMSQHIDAMRTIMIDAGEPA